MEVVVLLPAFAATVAWLALGWRKALVFVALPALLLLPAYYTWKLPGIPEFTFHNYLLLSLGAALVLARDRRRFPLSPIDLLPLAIAATAVISEHETKGFHDARNLAAVTVMLTVAPYALGRAVGWCDELLVPLVAVLVVLGAFIGVLSLYEARMGSNLFDFWRRIWPRYVPWDGALYRAGIRRTAGPFAHPICSGFFFSMVIPLALWLTQLCLPKQRGVRIGLLVSLVVGLLTSVSRGPIVGTLIACAVLRFGTSSLRKALAVAGLAMTPMLIGGAATAGVDMLPKSRGEAKSDTQETVGYRMEMLDNYVELVEERPMWGYGRYQIPIVKGQKSIDNQYLFLALTHGLPHAVLFLTLILVPAALLAIRLMGDAATTPVAGLGWALVGILAGASFTQTTVFAGTQTAQLIVLLAGLATSFAQRRRKK